MRQFQVTNLESLTRTLQEIARAGQSLQPLADDIGRLLVSQTVQRFVDETDPNGVPWIPSQRALREGNQTLTDTGTLRNSFTYTADDTGATVLTSVGYAVDHQVGIPPSKERAFMGLNDANEGEILDMALRHLVEASNR